MLITYLNNAATIAMGDEFDGFVDENYERELIPESMVLFCGFQMAHYIFDLQIIFMKLSWNSQIKSTQLRIMPGICNTVQPFLRPSR